jgi:hypothetical protein
MAAPEAQVLAGSLHVDTCKPLFRSEHSLNLRRRGIGAVVVDQQIDAQIAHLLPETCDKLAERRWIRRVRDDADVNDGHETPS